MHAHTYILICVCDHVLTKLYIKLSCCTILSTSNMIVTMLVHTGDYQHQGVHLKETQELLEASENRLEEASGAYVKCYMLVL